MWSQVDAHFAVFLIHNTEPYACQFFSFVRASRDHLEFVLYQIQALEVLFIREGYAFFRAFEVWTFDEAVSVAQC